jgi:hypothetical protein
MTGCPYPYTQFDYNLGLGVGLFFDSLNPSDFLFFIRVPREEGRRNRHRTPE